MKKTFLSALFSAIAVVSFAQSNQWKEYFKNEALTISTVYSECHQPSQGLHNENVLLRMVNHTAQPLTVTYHLKKVYNGKEIKGDISTYTFTIPANESIESTCEDQKDGLYIYSKILDVPAKSVLSSFELENLTINGQPVAQ